MVEIVSWLGVAVIALFAVVGFVGVVATTVLTVVRRLRGTTPPAGQVRNPQPMSRAA